MKLLLLAAILTVATATEEEPQGKMIQLCGAELAHAVKQVCEEGNRDYLWKHVLPHNHDHSHNHNHDDGDDHSHNHNDGDNHSHNHDHNHNHDDGHELEGHAKKRDVTFSYSLADECCAKPCHIAIFATYCPYD